MKLVETCLAREADPANGMTYHAVSQQNTLSTPQLFFARKSKLRVLRP